jgi:hypothetical protein
MDTEKANPASGAPRDNARVITKRISGQGMSPAMKPVAMPSPWTCGLALIARKISHNPIATSIRRLVHSIDGARPAPPPVVDPPPPPDGLVSATRFGRKLQALKLALEDLPRQARRLARWRLRREKAPSPKFRSPLRPDHPPGYRRKPIHEIDEVLIECHGLASDALKPDSS